MNHDALVSTFEPHKALRPYHDLGIESRVSTVMQKRRRALCVSVLQ